MTYKLTLETRRRLAANKRRRYWANQSERLSRINQARAQRGAPQIASLDEIGVRRRPDTWGRDDRGRFVPDRRV